MTQTAREWLAGAVRAGCDGIVLTLDEAATLLDALEAAEAEAARLREVVETADALCLASDRLLEAIGASVVADLEHEQWGRWTAVQLARFRAAEDWWRGELRRARERYTHARTVAPMPVAELEES